MTSLAELVGPNLSPEGLEELEAKSEQNCGMEPSSMGADNGIMWELCRGGIGGAEEVGGGGGGGGAVESI